MTENSPNATRIQGYNVVSAAVVIAGLGLAFSIAGIFFSPPGIDIYSIIGGIGLGVGLSGLYLGVQWNEKSRVNVLISLALAILSSALLVFAISSL